MRPRALAPWPQVAAVVPGALLHGAGPWLQGRSQTATRLMWWELSSLGLTLGSGTGLALTGAARDVVGPLALGGVFGVTLFSASFLAGLYAVSAPPQGFGSAPPAPALVASLGYRFVNNPHFSASHFQQTRLDANVGPTHFGFSTSIAPLQGKNNAGNGEERVLLGLRLWGREAIWDGGVRRKERDRAGENEQSDENVETHLELQTAWNQERFAADGFTSQSYEVALASRLDLRSILPDVRGAFLQSSAGYARQTTTFELPGLEVDDTRSLLLAHMGFGVYLGRPHEGGGWGETELYYDHRHDGLVAGLKVPGLGSGVAGHLGARIRWMARAPLGVELGAEFGSAVSLSLSLLVRLEKSKRHKVNN